MAAPANWVELEAKYKQDIEALTESTEMATIEKEIAEEKLDTCERELQELKDRLSEATIQIEMLQKDQQANQSTSTSNNESTVTVFQLQKVEEQNELLKQALIKLRDISAKDKKSLEDLEIAYEETQVKLLDLEEREQKHLDQIKIYEEQIDVSHSAQEMVEKLTQQKTDLEDKLREMVEDLDGMEKLSDLNDQLLENARQNEIELTEEMDKLRAQCSELNNRRRDLEEYLSDQERTVAKLKEENRHLTEQVGRLKDQFKMGESIEQQKHQIENVAYKLNFSESKMAEKEAEITRYRRNLAEMEEQMNSLSLITKEQSARLDDLKSKYETKTIENSDLQRALKRKMEEVSELEIRRDMAEKKLQALQKDTEIKIANLNRTIETMKGIEVQHEEDMKRLMEDNEIIERERRDLRDQLNKSNRSLERSMQTGGNLSLSMITAQDTSLASLGINFQTASSNQSSPLHHQQSMSGHQQQQHSLSQEAHQIHPTQAASLGSVPGQTRHISIAPDVDESVLISRIRDLSLAFDKVNRKNYELEMDFAIRELGKGITGDTNMALYYDVDRVRNLQAEAKKLKSEIRATILNQKICTKSRHIFSYARNNKFNHSRLALRYQALANEASALLSNSNMAKLWPLPAHAWKQSTPVK